MGVGRATKGDVADAEKEVGTAAEGAAGAGWGRGGPGGGAAGRGCATAPPCCALPAVPRGRRWLGLRSPFVCDALPGRRAAPAQRSLRGVPPPRPGPGRALLLFLRSSLLRPPAPRPELQPLGREQLRVLPRTLPRPARGVHPPPLPPCPPLHSSPHPRPPRWRK